MGFGDLAAQDQPDTAAAMFGGEEGYEKIVTVEEAGALVEDEDLNAARVGAPADFDRARVLQRGIKRGVDGIADQVDKHLFDLVRVGVNGYGRALKSFYRKAALQRC